MHAEEQYFTLLGHTWDAAVQLARAASENGYDRGMEVMQFLANHAAIAYPPQIANGNFGIGKWVTRSGGPATQQDAICVMHCMHDDILPAAKNLGDGASIHASDQLITLYDADLFTPLDRAVMLLHEGYHARHYLGLRFEGIHPTDPAHAHETNTWTFIYNILATGLTSRWAKVLQDDMRDIPRRLQGRVAKAGEIIFTLLNDYPTSLDALFGPTEHERVRRSRNTLVSVRSNTIYWAEKTGMPQGQVAGTIIINHLYA